MQMHQSKQNQMTIPLNTLFHPAISSPLPAPQVCVLPTCTGWRPCTLCLLDSPSLPSSPLQQGDSAQSSGSVLYKPMKESPARCSWGTDVYPIGLWGPEPSASKQASSFYSPAFLHMEGLPCLTGLLTRSLTFPPLLLWPEAQTWSPWIHRRRLQASVQSPTTSFLSR